MESITHLLSGLVHALTPGNVLFAFLGVLVGTVVGVLPGVGPITAISLLIPLSFGLDPAAGLILLCGIYYGAMYGGSTTSILIRTPGEVASAVTALDGYAMARKGRAGVALATAAVGSYLGGIAAVLGLVLVAPLLVKVSVAFGSAEYTVLMAGALAMTASLITGSRLKAVISVLFGMCVALVGTDSQSSVRRWTFGVLELSDGVSIALVAMALFAVPEALRQLSVGRTRPDGPVAMTGRAWMTREDLRLSWPAYVRGTLVGFFSGLLPGVGPTLGTFASYSLEKRVARGERRRLFGHGAIEGVAGPETANNAGVGASLIPMMTLAVPASATSALLLFVFQMYGLQPGPQLFNSDPDLVWTIVASMIVGNTMLLFLNLPMVRIFVKLLTVPPPLLYGAVIVFTVLGAYALTFSLSSLVLLLGIGLLGYCMQENGFPLTPAILAAVLTPLLEDNLRRALIISNGDWAVFVERPLSLTLLVLVALGAGVPTALSVRRRLRGPRTT
ncbi:tripartite tricarboxylate transporter permease [Streptomyces phaeolivaceus]|uniref:Tripartite tricarboxylate transporter permease n=1 Tax=Streptomyces phaeolivaceus TaxID=2653200 RepID=A0A5P8KE17_9ACTN|nr:tripartite tricarboxylate transporter permease [Streptomyces phaeolivaceus]QFR01574.1 tripartite tricarboxylate transporter permease [Streptomyces phaeolivaceus]